MSAAAVVRYLAERDVPFALIGARAMAFRGVVRSTLDTDFLTTDNTVLSDDFWKGLPAASLDVRRGDFDDPLAGVVRIGFPDDHIDLVVGRYRWQKAVVERAELLSFAGQNTPVARASDLVVLKIWSGGGLDLRDVRDLIAVDPAVSSEVDRLVSDLPDDARQLWGRVRAERDGLQ